MEVWKTIECYENYEISSYGNVRNKKTKRILKNQKDKDNYSILNLYLNKKGKTFRVHRLVAIAFLEKNENKIEVNHINGIKRDNRLENLEWCTRSENERHSLKNGFKIPLKGIDCKVSKLTEEIVIEILTKKRNSNGLKYWGAKDLVLKYNIKPSCISAIVKGRTWKHIKI
jgi:hypothetical protein